MSNPIQENASVSLERLKKYFEDNQDSLYQEFSQFLRFASISSEPSYKREMLVCADWVVKYLQQAGFQPELWPTSSYPIVFASYVVDPKLPTVLIYNHYDVQPVDPLDLWKSDPFTPTKVDNEVYARGAQDNKGQCFYTLSALTALLKLTKTLPVNIKLCIEGEEEFGSQGLSEIVEKKKKQLKADYLLVMDLGMRTAEKPAITLGVRGLLTMDIEVNGTHTDLHSGMHGGIAFNPIHALVKILASIRNEEGKITIPGFYDAVQEVSPEEKKILSLDFDQKEYLHNFGAEATGGEINYSTPERAWLRPTFEINGISGGYTGEGFKTVIPAKAYAKVSCRLVPDQDPYQIGLLVKKYIESLAPMGTQIHVNLHEGCGKAVRASPYCGLAQALAKSCEQVFHTPCEWIYEGGSIPVIAHIAEAIGSKVVLFGLGLSTDNIHAPNEHFGWDRVLKGFLTVALALQQLPKEETSA